MGEALGGQAADSRASKMLLACFYLLGMGVVCNWVALLQCQDYLGRLFTAYSPSRVLTAAYAAMDFLAQSLLFFFGDSLWANKRSRMVAGYAACTAATGMLPILDMYLLGAAAAAAAGPQTATATYFAAWTAYSLITGASSAIIGSVTYAQAAVFGPSYCQAFVCGRAASGLSCILVRCITKATLPDSPAGLRQSTLIFLGIASLIVLGCALVAVWLPADGPGSSAGTAAAAASLGCTPAAMVSKHALGQRAGSSTGSGSLREPLLLSAAPGDEDQLVQSPSAVVPQPGESPAVDPPRILKQQQQQQLGSSPGAVPHWCATEGAAGASRGALSSTMSSIKDPTAAAAAAATAQERPAQVSAEQELQLPRHLTCKTVSPFASLEDCIGGSAAAVSAAGEAFGWQPRSASVAAAAAAAGELSAFHSSFLESRSYASTLLQSPGPLSSYWYSGKQYSALPLLPQHAQHALSSVLCELAGQGNQQLQLALVCEGRSLVSSCWAAVMQMHAYMTAMGISFFVPCFLFPAMLSPTAGLWPAVGSWWTIMLVFAFQSGAVVGSALPVYSMQQPKATISRLAWGQFVLVPATVVALQMHAGPLVLLGITFVSMVYGYHVASLVFCLACEGLAAADDVELVQGLLVLMLTAARLAGLLMSWLWN